MHQHGISLLENKSIVVRKQHLFQTPDLPKTGVYVIAEGILRLYRIKEDGKIFTVGLLGEGDVFGNIDSLSFGGSRGVFIEALQETVLHTWDVEQMSGYFLHTPPVLKQMLTQMAERLDDLEQRMESLALDTVRERVLLLLVQMCSRFGCREGAYWRLTIPLSHQEIANMVGSSRETVSTTISQLAKEKLLCVSRMSIALHRSVMTPEHGT